MGLRLPGVRPAEQSLAATVRSTGAPGDRRVDRPRDHRLGRRLLRRRRRRRRCLQPGHRHVAQAGSFTSRCRAAAHRGLDRTRSLVLFVSGVDAADGKPSSARYARAAAYDPATDTWRWIAPLPEPRNGASVTWTDREILVVGGTNARGLPASYGLAYNPVLNHWRRLAAVARHTEGVTVWTGKRLLIWDGDTASPEGLAYDPRGNRWSRLPSAPLKGREGAVAVWTGTQCIVFGGVIGPSGRHEQFPQVPHRRRRLHAWRRSRSKHSSATNHCAAAIGTSTSMLLRTEMLARRSWVKTRASHARSGRSLRFGARSCTVLLVCVGVALTLGVAALFATSAPSFAGREELRNRNATSPDICRNR